MSRFVNMRSMQEAMLAAPMDVEELARLGRRQGACPYYAARAAMPEADLVLLPYAALLSQARPGTGGRPPPDVFGMRLICCSTLRHHMPRSACKRQARRVGLSMNRLGCTSCRLGLACPHCNVDPCCLSNGSALEAQYVTGPCKT